MVRMDPGVLAFQRCRAFTHKGIDVCRDLGLDLSHDLEGTRDLDPFGCELSGHGVLAVSTMNGAKSIVEPSDSLALNFETVIVRVRLSTLRSRSRTSRTPGVLSATRVKRI